MCKQSKQLIFCSCDTEALQEALHDKAGGDGRNVDYGQYIWSLLKFVSLDENAVGLIEPFEKVKGSLPVEFIIEEINQRNCFDFDYAPAEGDELHIEAANNFRDNLYLIYRNEKWVKDDDQYPEFGIELEQIGEGELKLSSRKV